MVQRNFIVSDPEKCTGCKICELVCSGIKEGSFNPLLSRIRTVKIEPSIDMSIACRLCEDPKCIKSCPRKALKKDEETNVIVVNEEECDGCCWCIQACDFGAISLHTTKGKIFICDLCELDPKCVQYCPKNALELMTPEKIGQKMRKTSIRTLHLSQ
jgi:Fe-S-cluster-containing hydrogenase component 2